MNKELIYKALSNVIDPDLHKDLVSLGMIQDLTFDENSKKIAFKLSLTTPACPLKEKLKNDCIAALKKDLGDDISVEIIYGVKPIEHKKPEKENLMPKTTNIILVASGKGGVGKSTVAANLAVSLGKSGAKVGLIDADIYGPSVPIMFQLMNTHPEATHVGDKTMILPIEKYGIKVMSIGFFVDPEKALIWRGPMASSALKQLFTDVIWDELDYLIIDTPPGTGDIHLSLVQMLNISGVVIVTTPQQVAAADARKAVNMFRADGINVPVLGIVENMSYFTPAELPTNKYYIFGKGGAEKLAEELKTEVLGNIPIVQSICESGDKGVPFIMNDDTALNVAFDEFASNTIRQMSIWNEMHEITDVEKHENCNCKH